MTTAMSVDIVVPVYVKNEYSLALARHSIPQLMERSRARVIVVDNGSELSELDLPHDLFVSLPENRGYSGGVNAGLLLADADVVVISSIDVFVPEGWQEPVVHDALYHWGVASPSAVKIRYGTNTGELESPLCVYWGGIFAAPRAIFDQLGGMDVDNFPLRFADTDFGVRAAKAGFWVGRVDDVLVEHHDPSMSTLFMPTEELQREYDRLFEVHGEFPMYEWHLGHWQ